jgi:uncharacterized protein (TIGR01777 family)
MAKPEVFVRSVPIAAPQELLFRWHAAAGAFDRLVPPWDRVELAYEPPMVAGERPVIHLRLGPLRLPWVARYERVDPSFGFVDVQERGPFRSWRHEHRMHPSEDGRSVLEDHVTYTLPLSPIGRFFGSGLARRKIERLFAWRHAVTRQDLARFAQETQPMRILITGSTGLLGSALTSAFKVAGHDIRRAVRGKPSAPGEILWQPERGFESPSELEGLDAVVHLAGDNIAAGRWNAAKKKRLVESRVGPTRLICENLAKLKQKPSVLICASAIGIYGSRGSEFLSEASTPGSDFLADLCQRWEAATEPAREAGIRVVNLRFGVILSSKGGALKKMLLPFKMGVGGRVGPGTQHMSWVALDDAVDGIRHAIKTPSLSGPVNLVAPTPVTNAEFTRTLGQVLNRPTIFPLPSFAARLAFGEVADALLLASQRVDSSRLQSSGFQFAYPTLDSALRHLLGRH